MINIIIAKDRKKANRDWHKRHDSKRKNPLYFLYDDDEDDEEE